ncbi:PqqD family protein [Prochlorococcus sp. MIT 1306]|uniref:PqqD family protein n=1 Tax=Prochlorococcus sp. MIT 1306 TaxID=1799667 RepID=UPI0007BB83D3|nr:hypothetical protein PMIT1306_00712 [Prochlorococcus sp. MIT 1306]
MTRFYSRVDDIFYSHKDGQYFLLDLNNSRYFELNEIAAMIWEQLDKNPTIHDISAIVSTYSSNELSIEELSNFLNVLKNHSLIIVS